jgi:uncharacterized protein YegL
MASLALGTALFALANPAPAADSWLSGVRSESKPAPGAAAGPAAGATSGTTVFDIVVSLQENPQGDNDSKVDAGASDDAQNAFEARIKEFANAVFQSTNGAHKIGRVTMYRDYKQRALADVQWDQNCAGDNGPWAMAGGFGKSGKYIHFCTNWSGAGTLMPDPKGSGYTLAHEWGHYAYNIYDEYAANQCQVNLSTLWGLTCPAWQPRSSDTVSNTIMHMQWAAADGVVEAGYAGSAADYLEFSTPNHVPFTGTGSNGQKRYYGESAWETLTRDPATDPNWTGLDRTQYTTLAAPVDPNWIVSGAIAGAQSELDIRWVGDQIVELMIDVSGSMSGSPLANAKTGANLLIQQLPDGQAAVGVGSFASGVAQNYAITDIPDPDTGVKSAAIAAVNALSTSGVTSLYDGLMLALDQVDNFQTTTGSTREGVVYVLSDGGDNDSTATEASVIAAYKAAKVPIVAFAYGSGAPTGTLSNMAAATGGLFLISPTTVSEIQAALLTANAAFSNNVLLNSSTAPASASVVSNLTVTVDDLLAAVTVNVNWVGAAGNFGLKLLNPAGADTGVAFDCQGSASCTASLDSAALAANGAGDYTVELTNTTAGDIDVSLLVSGSPVAGGGFDIRTAVTGGPVVTYPAPMLLTATVTNGTPITGLAVTTVVTDPANAKETLTLVDDGTGGDAIADDGTYTVSFHYMTNGTHSIKVDASNAAGAAMTANEGLSVAVGRDGTVQVPPSTAVPQNFTRVASASVSAAAVVADDHANDPLVPAACTPITDDNIGIAGRMDLAGDADCFFFTQTTNADPLVARVTNLTGGMLPMIEVFNANGTTSVGTADLTTSENDQVGVVITIPAADIDPAGHVLVIKHFDPAAATGGYLVSAGAKKISDTPSAAAAPVVPTSSGGGLGPWSLLVLSLLALFGLRQRRRA